MMLYISLFSRVLELHPFRLVLCKVLKIRMEVLFCLNRILILELAIITS